MSPRDQLAACISRKYPFSPQEMEQVLGCFQLLEPGKNELLLRPGQQGRHMYFVLEGCLRIFFINEEGQEATRYFAFENQFATALTAFITGAPSLEFVQALTACRLLCIGRDDFYRLAETIPAWQRFYIGYLEGAYVNNTHRLMSIYTMDAAERYRLLLEESPQVVQRLHNRMVASYLRMSQETLSRLKSKI